MVNKQRGIEQIDVRIKDYVHENYRPNSKELNELYKLFNANNLICFGQATSEMAKWLFQLLKEE